MRPTILAILAVAATLTAPAQESSQVWNFAYRYQSTTFNLKDVKGLMRATMEQYVSWGVPMRIQTSFPQNGLHAIELTRTKGLTRVGVGGAYGHSLWFSGFRDGNGHLTLSADVNVSLVYAIVGLTNIRVAGGGGYVGVKAGLAHASMASVEEVKFVDFPAYDVRNHQEASGSGHVIDLTAGWESRVIGQLVLGAEGGYRFASVNDLTIFTAAKKRDANIGGLHWSLMLGIQL